MTKKTDDQRHKQSFPRWLGLCAALAWAVSGCGGNGPLGNPPNVSNEVGEGGQKLSFAYFQRCINPIFLEQLPISGTSTTNTCAGAGCHDNSTGTGGAFRVVASAAVVDLNDPANTPEVIKGTDMYKNYISSFGEVYLGSISQSRLLAKPRVQGVLHGGGLIFETDQDPHVRLILYWMTHPAPLGQDEFSDDPGAGTCPTQ